MGGGFIRAMISIILHGRRVLTFRPTPQTQFSQCWATIAQKQTAIWALQQLSPDTCTVQKLTHACMKGMNKYRTQVVVLFSIAVLITPNSLYPHCILGTSMLIYTQTTCGQQQRTQGAVGISAKKKLPSLAPRHPRSRVITPARAHSPRLAIYFLLLRITAKICSS